MRHDVTFSLYIEIDEIYNLACPASPIHYQWDPVQTTKTSVHGAINMLGLAKRVKAKILQASTSEVYGDPEIHPQREDYWGHVNPIGFRSCYDEGKRCAETLFFDYHRQHKLYIKVARIFNTYGPRMHPNDGRVVSNFIVQALKGEPITIYGDGSQSRSFCYVDELVDGLVRLMATPDDFTGPVNLGNPCEFTMMELADFAMYVAVFSAIGPQPLAVTTNLTINFLRKPARADLIVRVAYDVDNGREKVRSTGFGGPYGAGFGGPWGGGFGGRWGRPWGYGFYDPWLFGGGGYNDVSSYTVYTSDLSMKIDRAADNRRLFEGKASAQSLSNKLTYLVPNLIDAMFTNFPGQNGEDVKITLPPEKKG